ncbi:hypothetical protein ABW19_dt0208433 [Dactylella cylindrospora]|nr:hypothetical protein ABW19_dt0208433 [Dactylella cylindrospora]
MDRNINEFFSASGGSSRGGRGDSRGRGGGFRGSNRGFHTSGDNTSQSNNDNASSSGSWGGRGDRGGRGGRGRGRGGRGGFMTPAKAERARLAKETINTTIPHILAHNTRAKAGVDGAAKYLPAQIPALSKTSGTYIPKISVINSDTFDGALSVITNILSTKPNEYASGKVRVGVLNMASNTNPGGGVLNGAQAQEETLCRRSTLYPSLLGTNFHPLNSGSIIFTPDVLVFMNQRYEMLKDAERYYVDVISAAAPKRPDLKTAAVDGVRKQRYENQQDYEDLTLTIKNILRIAVMKGVTHVVLGAFGCGAYGNPNDVVADVFKRAICGRKFGRDEKSLENWEKEEREVWSGIEEVVFAIYGDDRGKGNLDAFQDAFGEVMKWQEENKGQEEEKATDSGDWTLVDAVGEGASKAE